MIDVWAVVEVVTAARARSAAVVNFIWMMVCSWSVKLINYKLAQIQRF